MKVLILNGSPHVNGDTVYILNRIKVQLPDDTEFIEINAYESNIEPCCDCRFCWENEGCSKKDQMDVIIKDDYDVLIIASPLYMSYVTPPLFSIITRLNYIWSNSFFLNKKSTMKNKKGILVLTGGGGEGEPDNAINIAKTAFRFLNADFDINNDYIYSLKTNKILANCDNIFHIIRIFW